VDGEEEVKEFN